eukprot:TRINITY_DN47645_c0_g1_i2.p1 TRINITY_DN47645_c0_g1~~TRINITY_DN47645_c0_g1_i2.p1  ORF type:complete len:210 (-),score=35.71 TRINITY_DN47645_c0_g1_i2:113-742(-)
MDSKLEAAHVEVTRMITLREALLEDAKKAAQSAMTLYREQLGHSSFDILEPLVKILERIRMINVETIEVIQKWRTLKIEKKKQDQYGKRGFQEKSYVVTIATKGRRLYKPSEGFQSKTKRYCRPRDPHGKHATDVTYLGTFKTKTEAIEVYDNAAKKEAIRLGTSIALLPPMAIKLRSCGKHFSVETKGMIVFMFGIFLCFRFFFHNTY